MTDRFVLTLWTDDAATARAADAAGIDRIGVDLDHKGKLERQAGLGTWISAHTPSDLAALRPIVARGQLFARTNPLDDETAAEIEDLLAAGARVLMLPMFRSADDVECFVELVAGRAHVVGLLETAEALDDLDAVVRVAGLHELHVGINDLALALGLSNRFKILVGEEIERVARAVTGAGLRFGVGGVGHPLDGSLPISPDLIYAQYPRLGASAALISRSFLTGNRGMASDVQRLRYRLAWWWGRPHAELARAREELAAAIAANERF